MPAVQPTPTLFRYGLRKFLAFSEQAALAMGLTPQQHQALLAIKGAPEADSLSIKQIAERLLVRHHTAVGLIDRLVDLGMVTRTIDSTDRRRILVSLTKTGHSDPAWTFGDPRRRIEKHPPNAAEVATAV